MAWTIALKVTRLDGFRAVGDRLQRRRGITYPSHENPKEHSLAGYIALSP